MPGFVIEEFASVPHLVADVNQGLSDCLDLWAEVLAGWITVKRLSFIWLILVFSVGSQLWVAAALLEIVLIAFSTDVVGYSLL
jgi:hypothetical protein